MPYPLFDYIPDSPIHTMGSCSGKGNGKSSGKFMIGDYTYNCEQQCKNGKPSGEPKDCCWAGRNSPGTFPKMSKPGGFRAPSC